MKTIKGGFFMVLIFWGSALSAQDWYIQAGAGYGIGFPGTTVTTAQIDTSSWEYGNERIGLGGGLQANISVGALLDDNWGLDLQFFYQNNLNQTATSEYLDFFFNENEVTSAMVTEDNHFHTRAIGFSPSLYIKSGREKVRPFLAIGPSIYLTWLEESIIRTANSNIIYDRVEEYRSRVSFGAQARAGIEYVLSDNLLLNFALEYRSAYFRPDFSEITKLEDEGKSRLEDRTRRQKETEYVEKISEENMDDDKPDKQLTYTLDYSSVNLQLGFKILL